MRYTVLAVLVAPFCPALLSLDVTRLLQVFPNSAFDSIVGTLFYLIASGLVLYMPATLFVFLPVHLVLRKLKRKSAVIYCALLIPSGMAVQLYQTGGYVGSVGTFFQASVLMAIAVVAFWLIAVLVAELRTRSLLPQPEAPPEAGAPPS